MARACCRRPCAKPWRKPAGASNCSTWSGSTSGAAPSMGKAYALQLCRPCAGAPSGAAAGRRHHRALWLTRDEIAALGDSLRSPLVLLQHRRLAGRPAAAAGDPAQRARQGPGPMKVMLGVSGGVDSSVAALLLQQAGHEVEGLFMQNWEEDDAQRPLQRRRRPQGRRGRVRPPGHAFSCTQLRRRVLEWRVRAFPGRVPRRAHAQPRRVVQSRDQVSNFPRRGARAGRREDRHRPLRPDRLPRRRVAAAAGASTRPRTRPTSCMRWARQQLAATLFPIGETAQGRGARIGPRGRVCRRTPRRTPPASASSANATSATFLGSYIPARPGPDADARGHRWASTRA